MKTKAAKTPPVKNVPAKTSWRDLIKVHPAADLFPMMSDEELKALAEDIKANGLMTPVVMYDDGTGDEQLLDDRNRVAAAVMAGVVPDAHTVSANATDLQLRCGYPYAFVISANIHRRHLTAEQKRGIIAELLRADPTKSDRQVAETVKVDHKTIGAARAKLEASGEIPRVETRTDTKGRKQPSHPVTPSPIPVGRRAAPAEPTSAPIAPEQSAAPADDADQIDGLTSEQQDGVLHLMLVLLASVDHKHRKKFHKHLTDNSIDGVYLPSCGNRGWASGRYVVNDAVVRLVVDKLLARNGLPACSAAAPAALEPSKESAEITKLLVSYPSSILDEVVESSRPLTKPKRKRRTKTQIAADEAAQRERLQAMEDGMAGDACVIRSLHEEIADAIAADPSAPDEQLAKQFHVAPRTVAFVRENGGADDMQRCRRRPICGLPADRAARAGDG
jgi:hypothetical protein